MAWMSERGYWPTCVPGIGCEGCVVGRVKVLDPCRHFQVRKGCVLGARASSSRRKACWRFEYAGPRMSRHASRIRCRLLCPVWEPLCRVAYAAAYVSRRTGGVSHYLEAKMSGCVCPVMRRTPDGGFLPLSGDLYVGLCMSGHAQPAEHGPALPYSVDICSASHAAAYRTCARRPER